MKVYGEDGTAITADRDQISVLVNDGWLLKKPEVKKAASAHAELPAAEADARKRRVKSPKRIPVEK